MIERLDRFMARANAAYYANCDPFADFTTAPEISQVFGELLGLWCGLVWQMMGAPASVCLVEAGPGRGTLMADALRAVDRALPGFASARSLHFIETSPRLSSILRGTFPEAATHDDLSGLPNEPTIFLANEFFDALPIRQFIRQSDGWVERFVDGGNWAHRSTELRLPEDAVGTVRERCEVGEDFMAGLAARLHRYGGVGLIVDYGPSRSGAGETLQAIRNGAPADPLAEPGTADLTAHVDFAALAARAIAAGCKVSGPVTQGEFLIALGIHERTAQLGRTAEPAMALSLMAATRRLTMQEAMGSLFKVMAVSHPALPKLPGFCR